MNECRNERMNVFKFEIHVVFKIRFVVIAKNVCIANVGRVCVCVYVCACVEGEMYVCVWN